MSPADLRGGSFSTILHWSCAVISLLGTGWQNTFHLVCIWPCVAHDSYAALLGRGNVVCGWYCIWWVVYNEHTCVPFSSTTFAERSVLTKWIAACIWTTTLWAREQAASVPSVNGRPPSGTFEPLMVEGKYVHWAPLESLTLAGAYQPSLLSSADISHVVLLCAVALSVASMERGSLDAYSNAASAQRYPLILFNFQRHHKSDMKHPWERTRDHKALWKRISKARAWQKKVGETRLCFLIHMLCLLLEISRSFWICHIQADIF